MNERIVGSKSDRRSSTRPVATEVSEGLRVPKRGQGEIKGQKGNPKTKGGQRERSTNRARGPDRRTENNTEVAWQKPRGRAAAEGGCGVSRVLGCRRVRKGTGGRGSEWAGRVSGPASWRLGYSD